jgi:xanthine dehydrogenase YagR molybdenum-binding subunit
MVGVAAAIANAVYHATGVRVRKVPIRIEDLLA